MKPEHDLIERRRKGREKGTGKNFEIKDSDYLNITLESSEEIIVNKTRSSTYELTDSGWSDESIGEWDEITRVATLEQDIDQGIEIKVTDATTLDGQGHTITGSGTGNGIFLDSGIHNVIIMNLIITGFGNGINLDNSNGNIINNTIMNNKGDGIHLSNSAGTITENIINVNVENGIDLSSGSTGEIINNMISGNRINGIQLSNSASTITENTIEHNLENGIYLSNNIDDNITNNVIEGNLMNGIHLDSSDGDIINNTIINNIQYGIYFVGNNDFFNIIERNCILNNLYGIYIMMNTNNKFFTNNNFINSTNGYSDGVNFFDYNYWDDWVIGSGPYRIPPGGESDLNPLESPEDITAPITKISLSGILGNNDWYISDVDVTLTAEAISSCSSAVKKTSYSIDGSPYEIYGSPFELSNQGIITIYYYSEDVSDKTENKKIEKVKIDKTPPEIIINVPADGSEYELDESVIADWSVSDKYSGVASYSGTVPSGAPIDTSSVGEKSFTVEATDNAGNNSLHTIKYYVKENIAPITTISLSGTLGNNGWYTSNVQVTLTAEEYPGGLDVDKTLYSFNNTDWDEYKNPFYINTEGITTVYYYSVDKSGNVEHTKTKEVKIDKTPPEIIINVPADGSEYEVNETIIADWSVSDKYSGVASSTGTVPSGDPIDTSSLGEKKFIVEATDNAGHSLLKTTKYYVKTKILKRGFKLIDF